MEVLINELIPCETVKNMTQWYVEEFLTSTNNIFIVFDGTSKPLFKGTLNECVAYKNIVGKNYLSIYSEEAYNKIIHKIGI